MTMPYKPDEVYRHGATRDAEDEQLVGAAFGSLPVVSCPDEVVRRIEQAVDRDGDAATTVAAAAAADSKTVRRRATRPRQAVSGRLGIGLGAGLAAAAAAWLLLARPTAPPEATVARTDGVTVVAAAAWRDGNGPGRATREAREGLALATRLLQRSEQIVFEEALAKPLPGAVRQSLRRTMSLVQGGRG
jgi:hypothetical protein